jgi:hypothetical protein
LDWNWNCFLVLAAALDASAGGASTTGALRLLARCGEVEAQEEDREQRTDSFPSILDSSFWTHFSVALLWLVDGLYSDRAILSSARRSSRQAS